MTFLPLLERELRARARSRATFWTRFGVVVAAMLVCLPELLSGGFGNQAGSNGKFIFNGIVVVAFLLACGGCLLTADVISRERREGTLGLLLLTRVRNLDVLLGKFGSAGLTSICGLAALLPLMMIPVLVGGVTGGEAFRKGLALLNTLFLALAAGLWASAAAKEQARAVGRTIRLLAALILVPLVLTVFEPLRLWLAGPISTLFVADDQAYKSSATPYWISLGLVHAIAWAHFFGAACRLQNSTSETEEKIPTRFVGDEYYQSLKRKWPQAWSGKALQPIQFLTQRQRGIRATIWAAALIALILQFGGLALMPFGFFGFLSIIRWLPIHLIPAALLAWAMSRFMVEARRSGAFELLMTTPLGAKTIVSAQWNALKQLLWGPLLVMLAPYLFQILIVGWRWTLDQMIRQWAFIFFGLTNTIFGIAACCWAALWFGFKVRSQAAAIGWTVGMAKAVPFLIYLTSQGLFSVGIIPTGISSPYDVRWYVPQLLTLLFYVRLMVWVRARFAGELAGAEPLRFTLLRLVSQETPQPRMNFETAGD
jgi:ABC-type transport system involved in multi-copper enzyme maturation permease subunit